MAASHRRAAHRVAGILLAAAVHGAAHAQTGTTPEIVTVTGAHLPDPAGQRAFSTVSLDAGQLEAFDQLDAALEQVPGLSLFRRSSSESANPTIQGVSLRAIAPSASSRALVLLDGIPLNDPFGGWVIWNALPEEDIGGAEILRGAGSGPYGSGALTGTILLREQDGRDGIAQADVSAGSLDTFRAGAAAGAQIGGVQLFASGAAEHSNGWIPVEPDARGAADNDVRLDTGAATLRAQAQPGGDIDATVRLGYYDELQGAGLVGAQATAQGGTASVTLARPVSSGETGWRVQAWAIDSTLSNISVSTQPNQSATTPANDQYATPALGVGFNVALLGENGSLRWEAGGDLRDDSGQSREYYGFSAAKNAYLDARRAGGRMIVAGLYGDGALDLGPWLLTLGVRADEWATSQGHLLQSVRASGAVTLDADYAGRDGAVPTGRAGLRRDFDDGEFLRVAAYEGFRAPTLNELYRPFRVGNVVTNANPALTPERLDGVETGWGITAGPVAASATAYWNRLRDAIESVSQCAAVLITCDVQQRENVQAIDASGLEAEVTDRLSAHWALRAALAWTDARVDPGASAPQLKGKRPAQAPPASATAGANWQPWTALTCDADLRWIGAQFEDDRNTIRLGSALTLDLQAAWHAGEGISVFGRIDNATGARIATGNTTGVINTGAPRIFEIGLRYAP